MRIFKSNPAPPPVVTAPPLTAEQKREAANATYWDVIEGKGKGRQERLWGFENFGNTCYCNSVLQALYSCEPFKQFVESYPSIPPPVNAIGPPPGEANLPKKDEPSSPIASKKDNPFETPQSPPGRSWKLGRRPTSSSIPAAEKMDKVEKPKVPEREIPKYDIVLPEPNPNQPPPSVFETVQTLFQHLSLSPPHQPLPSRKEASEQTASVLAPAPAPDAMKQDVPQGPPLLASLPPPSAPRGGGPFSAGTLGRGVVRPEDVLKTIKRENEMFRGMAQQDAHEFLGWVLNKIAEEVEQVDKHLRAKGQSAVQLNNKTFVQNLFEGCLTNETRCLSCETTSSRDELFLDLSIDIEQHTSVTSCLRGFSASEMLCQKNKFYCESCCGLQEAEKRMKIKRLPNILALHLKRFKYQESLGRYTKLFYRVPFPLQLRLPNTSDDAEDADRLYELFAVVVHIGNGPHHGHYVCMVKSAGRWIMCDDENIEPIDEADIFRYFGDYPSGAGYVLFYQAADLDLGALGLKVPPTPSTAPPSTMPIQMTFDEQLSPIQQSPPSPKMPLHVDTSPVKPVVSPKPSPKQATQPYAPSPVTPAPVSASAPAPAPVRASPAAPPVLAPPVTATTPTSSTNANASDKDKWYSFNKKPPTPRSDSAVGLGLSMPSETNTPSELSRKTSVNNRSASGSSYSGGGGLGRKLSGMSGKGLMSRSGSLMKLGLGKKKDNINE